MQRCRRTSGYRIGKRWNSGQLGRQHRRGQRGWNAETREPAQYLKGL